MDDRIIEFSNIIFNIKEKITDGVYMELMDKLSKIRDQYNIDKNTKCKCDPNSLDFCTDKITNFIVCTNYKKTLKVLPHLKNIIIYFANTKSKQDAYFNIPIQFDPIHENSEHANDLPNDDLIKYISKCIVFTNKSVNIFCKIIIVISLFDLIFKHIDKICKLGNGRFINVCYKKLIELYDDDNPNNNININANHEKIKKIYELDKNVFELFKDKLEPIITKINQDKINAEMTKA